MSGSDPSLPVTVPRRSKPCRSTSPIEAQSLSRLLALAGLSVEARADATACKLRQRHTRQMFQSNSLTGRQLASWSHLKSLPTGLRNSARNSCPTLSRGLFGHSEPKSTPRSALPSSSSLKAQSSSCWVARLRPNPSIERTRSGGAGLAFISFWAKPTPPPRAAHVKR